MRKSLPTTLLSAAVAAALPQLALAQTPPSARSIIAEHCIECHRVPGFALEGHTPAVNAPDFQAIADDRKTYTSERLVAFLRKPHFPMRRVTLSEGDILRLVAFIEGLRRTPDVQ